MKNELRCQPLVHASRKGLAQIPPVSRAIYNRELLRRMVLQRRIAAELIRRRDSMK